MDFGNPKNRDSIIGHRPFWGRFTRDDRGHTSIAKDAERTWKPEDKATEKQMEFVLGLLIEAGQMSQQHVAKALILEWNISSGYANAIASASLLRFRQEGWIEVTERKGRSNIWRVIA